MCHWWNNLNEIKQNVQNGAVNCAGTTHIDNHLLSVWTLLLLLLGWFFCRLVYVLIFVDIFSCSYSLGFPVLLRFLSQKSSHLVEHKFTITIKFEFNPAYKCICRKGNDNDNDNDLRKKNKNKKTRIPRDTDRWFAVCVRVLECRKV